MSVESNLLKAKCILNLSDDEFDGVKSAVEQMKDERSVTGFKHLDRKTAY